MLFLSLKDILLFNLDIIPSSFKLDRTTTELTVDIWALWPQSDGGDFGLVEGHRVSELANHLYRNRMFGTLLVRQRIPSSKKERSRSSGVFQALA